MRPNKYLVKIAGSLEWDATKAGLRAVAGDTVGTVAGGLAGGAIGKHFDKSDSKDPHKYQHLGELAGGGLAGAGLTLHSVRHSMLEKARKVAT